MSKVITKQITLTGNFFMFFSKTHNISRIYILNHHESLYAKKLNDMKYERIAIKPAGYEIAEKFRRELGMKTLSKTVTFILKKVDEMNLIGDIIQFRKGRVKKRKVNYKYTRLSLKGEGYVIAKKLKELLGVKTISIAVTFILVELNEMNIVGDIIRYEE